MATEAFGTATEPLAMATEALGRGTEPLAHAWERFRRECGSLRAAGWTALLGGANMCRTPVHASTRCRPKQRQPVARNGTKATRPQANKRRPRWMWERESDPEGVKRERATTTRRVRPLRGRSTRTHGPGAALAEPRLPPATCCQPFGLSDQTRHAVPHSGQTAPAASPARS